MGRLVICNTTPIIALSLVGQLPLLQRLYGAVTIRAAVAAELLAGGPAGAGIAELQQADWLRQMSLSDPTRADLLSDLGRREAEVIALAQELGADLLIIDERLGRRHAERLGFEVTGTLGVLLRAKEQGLIAEMRPLIEQLRKQGIRLAEPLVRRALELANEH
jgi:predicted nucleic acid-binding protein